MSYHPALEAILDIPELRKNKKLHIKQQRETYKKSSLELIKEINKT